MWARTVEIVLACWLAISPFVFNHPGDAALLWYSDYACALTIILISSLALSTRFEKAHYLNVAVSAYLIAVGFIAGTVPPPPPYQNYIVVGIVLMVFAVIPAPTTLPPRSWQQFYAEQQ